MPTNRLDQPKAEKRSELVQAACRLFLQDGFDRTSMSRIASEAGVTPNTIYYKYYYSLKKYFFLIHSSKVLRDLSFEETIGFLIGQLIFKF